MAQVIPPANVIANNIAGQARADVNAAAQQANVPIPQPPAGPQGQRQQEEQINQHIEEDIKAVQGRIYTHMRDLIDLSKALEQSVANIQQRVAMFKEQNIVQFEYAEQCEQAYTCLYTAVKSLLDNQISKPAMNTKTFRRAKAEDDPTNFEKHYDNIAKQMQKCNVDNVTSNKLNLLERCRFNIGPTQIIHEDDVEVLQATITKVNAIGSEFNYHTKQLLEFLSYSHLTQSGVATLAKYSLFWMQTSRALHVLSLATLLNILTSFITIPRNLAYEDKYIPVDGTSMVVMYDRASNKFIQKSMNEVAFDPRLSPISCSQLLHSSFNAALAADGNSLIGLSTIMCSTMVGGNKILIQARPGIVNTVQGITGTFFVGPVDFVVNSVGTPVYHATQSMLQATTPYHLVAAAAAVGAGLGATWLVKKRMNRKRPIDENSAPVDVEAANAVQVEAAAETEAAIEMLRPPKKRRTRRR